MSKLTPETQTKIIQLLKLGTPQKYAAEACGIDEATFYQWIKLGRNKKEGKYYEFAESIKRANSEAMAIKLADLEKAAQKGNVSAITWFLEHKYPDIFGNKLQIEYTGKITFDQFRQLFNNEDKKENVRSLSKDGVVVTPKIIQLPNSDNK